jgi:putative iron-dependent peroxidase
MNTAPRLSQQLGDIQALLGSGMGGLTHSRFHLLTVKDAGAARQWLAALLASGLVRSVADLNRAHQARDQARAAGQGADQAVEEVVSVAFSHAGLLALGLTVHDAFPFPTPFRSGMGSAAREDLLRDGPRDGWRWDDTGTHGPRPVHLLLACWWSGAAASALPALPAAAFEGAAVDGCPSFFRGGKLYEPFGFRDGIAQPVILGLRDETDGSREAAIADAGPFYRDRIVAPGEFIVGYRNEFGESSYAPDITGWPRPTKPGAPSRFSINGSYLAVRQIRQHVDEFEAFVREAGPRPMPPGATPAEKLMGRLRDPQGTPLGWRGAACPVSDSAADAFRYRTEDAEGFLCPPGAHVRRANPRDTLGHDVDSGVEASKLHRLLRRGRPYREGTAAESHQGLFFIACNADLERQFEFVHQRWLRNPRFAGLEGQDDPVVGAPAAARPFMMPAAPTGTRLSLASFTDTLGGGYFFLPGLRALGFMAQGVGASAQAPAGAGSLGD